MSDAANRSWVDAQREGWNASWLALPDPKASVETWAEYGARCTAWLDAPHLPDDVQGYRAWRLAQPDPSDFPLPPATS